MGPTSSEAQPRTESQRQPSPVETRTIMSRVPLWSDDDGTRRGIGRGDSDRHRHLFESSSPIGGATSSEAHQPETLSPPHQNPKHARARALAAAAPTPIPTRRRAQKP
jgi:hypothetical protein